MENFTNKPIQDLEKISDEELLKICNTTKMNDPQWIEAKRILDKRRDAKPLEEMSDEELWSVVCSFGTVFLPFNEPKDPRYTQARKILDQRAAEREKQRKKALDDGSIKGLILSGDYSEVNHAVIIQNISSDGSIIWIYRDESYSNDIITAAKDSEDDYEWNKAEECALKIITICRRRLKREDIILCGVDSASDCVKNGIVFTENKIYTFYERKPEYIIEYSEIDNIDYTDDSVIIKTVNDEAVELHFNENPEEYAENMFNLLMDIKDRLSES